MSEEISQTVLAEIVKKITVEDGDILIVRTQDDSILEQLANAITEVNADRNVHVLLVEESQVDILRGMDEETMREYGWERISE